MENKKLWKKIPGWLNGFRLVILNIVFFGLLLVFIVAGVGQAVPEIPQRAVLVINPTGRLVTRYSEAPWMRNWKQSGGAPAGETLLNDLLYALDQAGRDNRIKAIYLDLAGLGYSGMAMIEPLAQEIERIKDLGIPVYGYSNYITQEQLYLLSLCDFWAADPLVALEAMGYSSSRLYFARAMERWGFEAHIFKAGDFKSFTEVYSEEGLSEDSRRELRRWMDILWNQYLSGLSSHLADSVKEEIPIAPLVERFPESLEQHGGSWASLLESQGWINAVMTRDRFQDHLLSELDFNRGGVFQDSAGIGFLSEGENSISFQNYIFQLKEERFTPQAVIAFLPLSGEIRYGEGDWGIIGSESVIRVLDSLDPLDYQGLLIWMDSPGGSAIASEEIRRALVRVQERGIPVSLVMANACASGGYWISTAADFLVASPHSITGSIGVFSYSFSAGEWLEQQWGILEDGYSTTAQAQGYSLVSPPSMEFQNMQQSQVDFIYSQFLSLVEKSRRLDRNVLEEVAQGRIWTGTEAREIGLVDALGYYPEAITWHGESLGLESHDLGLVLIEEDYLFNQSGLWNLAGRVRGSSLLEEYIMTRINEVSMPRELGFNDPQNISAWSLVGSAFLP